MIRRKNQKGISQESMISISLSSLRTRTSSYMIRAGLKLGRNRTIPQCRNFLSREETNQVFKSKFIASGNILLMTRSESMLMVM